MRLWFCFLLMCFAGLAAAQQASRCEVRVWLFNGGHYAGRLLAHYPDSLLVLELSGGVEMRIPDAAIRKIRENCPGKETLGFTSTRKFQETGLYYHMWMSTLNGTNEQGFSSAGISMMFSLGYQIKRQLGIGLSTGMEIYNPEGFDAVTQPVLLEARSYFMAGHTSFYGLAAVGYAWAGDHVPQWGILETYQGGLCTKALLGLRIGRHFTLHGGLAIQEKKRTWQTIEGISASGVDKIWHKRWDIGMGYLF